MCLTTNISDMNHSSASSENNEKILHVLYNYTSKGEDELTLKRGSVVEVLSKDERISGSEGWWTGRLVDDKSVGIFPANFVTNSKPDLRVINETDLQIGDLIGIGGFGHVHYGKFGDVEVAIKSAKSLSSFRTMRTPTLNRQSDKKDSSDAVQKNLIDDLLREARLFSDLKHGNIVQLYGVCPSFSTRNLYLIMEYAHGGALSQLLQQRQAGLFPHVFIHYAKQITDGMKYLHHEAIENIIHRDLKCSNILIFEAIKDIQDETELLQKTLKITDFGLAKKQFQSSSMSAAGTYPWMSPECITDGLYSPASDVWSFGVLLWECLTGEIPYQGFTQMQVAFGIGMKKFSLPIPSTCPEEFAQLMRNCWQHSPDERPKFSELFDQITEIIKRNYADHDLQNCSSDEDAYQSLQQDWREEIKTMFEQLKNMEREIQDREETLKKNSIEQNHQRMELEKWQRKLHEQEMQLIERELKLLMSPNTQERTPQQAPKVQKRSGHFMRQLLHAALNGHATLSSATANTMISSPTNFRHVISVSYDQGFRPSRSTPDATSKAFVTTDDLTTNSNRIRTLTSSDESRLNLIDKRELSSDRHVHCQSPSEPSELSTSSDTKYNRSSSCGQNKVLSGATKRSRWRRTNLRSPTLGNKRKHGKINSRHSEPKWYLESKPSITENDPPKTSPTLSSSKSTPTLDRANRNLVSHSANDLSSSTSSLCSAATAEHSVARGLFHINKLLMSVGLGHRVPSPFNSPTSMRTKETSPSHPHMVHSASEQFTRSTLSTSSSSTTSSPPLKKQHKRTSSSPIDHIQTDVSDFSVNGYRARPSYSPVRPSSLVFTAIPPPPSPRSAHISQSDSQLNHQSKNHSRKMTSTPEENEPPSPTLANLSKSEQQLHLSSILDIETEEQKRHQTKVLPPETDRQKQFVSLEALERDFLA